MLVKQDGQDDFVKVLDFGLALISRHLNSSEEGEEHRAKTAPKITQVGEIFGTPSYMAPEQTVSATTDIRTDLYALGILLYEMLTGLRPFVGKNPVSIIQQQLVKPPPPMKERAPNVQVTADMEALVMRLLAKQPAERFQTPEELIIAIDRIGAQHHLAWPGSSSASHRALSGVATLRIDPKKPQASRLTLRLATLRTHLSSRLQQLRSKLFPKPTPKSKLGQALDAIQQQFDKRNRKKRRLPLWLIVSTACLMIVLLAGILSRTRKPMESPASAPDSQSRNGVSSPQPAPSQDAASPPPAHRGGIRHPRR
jgi:serine/threonine protein kinase